HVDDQVVELAPFDQTEKLTNDLVQHGAAPDDGLVAGIEKSDGDDFEAEGFERLDAIFADHARLSVDAEHERDVGAVGVGVEQYDLMAEFDQRDGEIDRECGLADPAFAGTDGDDGIDAGKGLRGGGWCAVGMRVCQDQTPSSVLTI